MEWCADNLQGDMSCVRGRSTLVLLLAVVAACGVTAQNRDPKFFHTRKFWDGFESGLNDAGVEVQKRLDDNLETVLDHVTNMGDSIGSLSRRLEDQVQDLMPSWMRHRGGHGAHRYPQWTRPTGHQDAPVEAIIGSLGVNAVDDGLKVYFKGDSDQDQDDLPEPHIIPRGSYDDLLNRARDENSAPNTPPPPQTVGLPMGDPLIALNFGFGDRIRGRFPMFPNFGGSPFTWTARVQPWWKGDNVCIDEIEIDEPEQNSEDSDSDAEDKAVQEADEEIQEEIERERIEEEEEVAAARPSAARAFFFGQMEIHSCSEDQNKYTCTTSTRRRGLNRTERKVYRCCHGFLKEATGCTKVNMLPLSESLEQLELTDFLSQLKSAGKMDMIDERNLTIFAPSNEALEDYAIDIAERNDLDISDNEVYRRKRSSDTDDVNQMVLSHMTDGFLYSGDMEDEQILESQMPGSTLRVNIYRGQSPPIVTVNCARVTTANQPAINGIVHTIDRIVKPATRTIGDIISNDPQFTTLKKLVSAAGLLQQLRDAGQLTLFAPTDAAFAASIPQEELKALIEGSSCLSAIMKNHLLPNVICTSAVTNPVAKTINMLDRHLKIRLQDSGKLFVEDAQIVAKDIMGTNGIIHIIDAPLMPSEAKSVLEVLENQNLTHFLDLLRIAELTKEMEELRDIAILAPSNEAIDNVDQDYLNDLKKDRERLREVLLYHVSSSPLTDSSLRNNHLATTQSGHPLRMNLYTGPMILSLSSLMNPVANRVRLTAGCGRVTLLDSRACGASVHIVDSLLEPPREAVLEALEKDPNFSIFSKIAKESSLAEELSSGAGPVTVLAPSDHVFRTLPEDELESLLADAELKEELVKRHTLREHMCCSGISPNLFSFRDNARTVHGSTISLHQTSSGLLRAGSARITHCAKPSHNGLVHTVNRLFVEPHIVDENAESRWSSDRSKPLIIDLPALAQNLFGGGQ